MDIVEKLRHAGDHASYLPHLHHEAADKIEWLREALKKICHVTGSDMEAYDIAENALKGGK